MPSLTTQQCFQLADAILQLPGMEIQSRREQIVRDLKSTISASVQHDSAARPHVLNIIRTCTDYPDGLTNLREVLHFHYQGTTGLANVETLLDSCNVTVANLPDLPGNSTEPQQNVITGVVSGQFVTGVTHVTIYTPAVPQAESTATTSATPRISRADRARIRHLEEALKSTEQQLIATYDAIRTEISPANRILLEEQGKRFSENIRNIEHELERLQPQSRDPPGTQNPPDIERYLQQLIEKTTAYIASRRPVALDAEDTPSAIQSLLDWDDRDFSPVAFDIADPQSQTPTTRYSSFEEAHTACGRRMLLLGQPGAGKSTTLQSYALKAAKDRRANPDLPIPVVVFLHRIKDVRFTDLPPGALPALLHNAAARNGASLFAGHALLYILDGLDEMGGERPIDLNKPDGEKCDPRSEFLQCLQQLPSEPLVISCRISDYEEIGRKLDLPGAVRLLPLSDQKIREFLLEKQNQPHLWTTLSADSALLELARTPLLLALLSSALGTSKEPLNVNSANGVIAFYIDSRYVHESGKRPVLFSLEETKYLLGTMARQMWRITKSPQQSLSFTELNSILKGQVVAFLELVSAMHFLVSLPDQTAWGFPHLAFRDHLAVPVLIKALGDFNWVERWRAAGVLGEIGPTAAEAIPALIATLGDAENQVRLLVADALHRIGPAAVPALMAALGDHNWVVRRSAAGILGAIGPAAGEAIPALIATLTDDHEASRVSGVWALSQINSESVEVIAALRRALTDNDENVRTVAYEALLGIYSSCTPSERGPARALRP